MILRISKIGTFNPLAVILKENKLIGLSYIEWKSNLDIVLIAEEYKYILVEECPPTSTDSSSEKEKESYKKRIKEDEMTRCYILASMSGVLQHQIRPCHDL